MNTKGEDLNMVMARQYFQNIFIAAKIKEEIAIRDLRMNTFTQIQESSDLSDSPLNRWLQHIQNPKG